MLTLNYIVMKNKFESIVSSKFEEVKTGKKSLRGGGTTLKMVSTIGNSDYKIVTDPII